ncbi:NgoPII family restriction endonuclease, partial [Tumidithrix elongata RA019]|nr:NgoPII family restriction endonuclease [Tumidithrix elongata RA019]
SHLIFLYILYLFHAYLLIEFAETNELGRVNKVDPLGITYLRIRGMWGIENPLNVYDYVDLGYDAKNEFQIIAIMKASKYQSFPVEIRREIENLSGEENFEIMDRQIRSPDNPAKLINAKIISYKR